MSSLISLVEEVTFGKLDIRLARHLLKSCDNDASLETTHQQLATELGSAREVISRQLKDFEQKGWIEQQRGQIQLQQEDALQQLAHSSN